MTIIVCYSKCEPCQFGEHPSEPHTWMGFDDIDHAVTTGQMAVAPPDAELIASRPCGCHCMRPGYVAPLPEPEPERDYWQEYKDDLAQGLIHEDGSYREPDYDAPDYDEVAP